MLLTLLVDILITSNKQKKAVLKFLGLQKVSLKSTKIHENFFIESNHLSILGINISSNEHGQVTLLTFDNALANGVPPMWLHHILHGTTKLNR